MAKKYKTGFVILKDKYSPWRYILVNKHEKRGGILWMGTKKEVKSKKKYFDKLCSQKRRDSQKSQFYSKKIRRCDKNGKKEES